MPLKPEFNGIVLDTAAARLIKGDQTADLTKNEVKILYCLYEHPGEFVSREDIIDYLWDNEVFIDDNTLSVHVTRIRNKLKVLVWRTLLKHGGEWDTVSIENPGMSVGGHWGNICQRGNMRKKGAL